MLFLSSSYELCEFRVRGFLKLLLLLYMSSKNSIVRPNNKLHHILTLLLGYSNRLSTDYTINWYCFLSLPLLLWLANWKVLSFFCLVLLLGYSGSISIVLVHNSTLKYLSEKQTTLYQGILHLLFLIWSCTNFLKYIVSYWHGAQSPLCSFMFHFNGGKK